MDHKVKKAFTDRDTGYRYAEGDIYTGTDARVTELQKAGHLTAAPVKDAEPTAKSDKK